MIGGTMSKAVVMNLSCQAIRRRLTAAAETLGKDLEVRRTADAVYFWPSVGRRRGRPRKDPFE